MHIRNLCNALLLAPAIMLTGCGSAPVMKQPVYGMLKDTREASVQYQASPAQTAVLFQTTGYTIVGVAYVAAAVAKMKTQSEETHQAFAEHLKGHPEVVSLQEAFNQELAQFLQKRGVTVAKVAAKREVNDRQQVTYDTSHAGIKTRWAVILDGLGAQYYANSSTDNYVPRSGVFVTVLDMSKPGDPGTQFNIEERNDTASTAFTYKDYQAIKDNTGQAYEGLRQSVARLAEQVGRGLLEVKVGDPNPGRS